MLGRFLEKNGFRLSLLKYYVLDGYWNLTLCVSPQHNGVVLSCSVKGPMRNPRVEIDQHATGVTLIQIDGLMPPRYECEKGQAPDFIIEIGAENCKVETTRDELLPTYSGQYNKSINDFWALIKEKGAGTFLEVGGRGAASAAVRARVPEGWKYLAADCHPGPNVDLVCDLHFLSKVVEPESIDVIYSSSVFEHIFMPWLMVVECNKVLRGGGVMFTATPNCWPRHSEPWDFWRIMEEGWHALFNRETGFDVLRTDVYEEVMIVPKVMTAHRSQIPQAGKAWLGTSCLASKTGDCRQTLAYSPDLTKGVYPLSGVAT